MKYVFIFIIAALLSGCDEPERMCKLTLLEERLLDSVPSGSGVVMHNERLLIVTDDAPFIYDLSPRDYSYTVIPLKGYTAEHYRIPKPVKPDFEGATIGTIKAKQYLFAFGSGSKSPARDSLLIIDLNDFSEQRIIPLTAFYHALRQQTGITQEQWNIEGAVIDNDSLMLLNRGNNGIITMNWNAFENFLTTGIMPFAGHYKIGLPKYRQYLARFSGASKLNDEGDILFSASIEDTPNWYTDGNVIGSYIGIFNSKKRELKYVSLIEKADGLPLKEKIESVEILNGGEHSADIIAVADDDKGHTKLIRMRMDW